jgi:hypothetical protein
MIATREDFVDDIEPMPTEKYIKVDFTKSLQLFSSFLHGRANFEVIHPTGITEFPALSDPVMKTVMASNIFKPGMIAINFGMPNVATFITEEKEDGSVQTIKVDAKSLWREPMGFHPTNGKIQSGVFLIPKNLPPEALARFKEAAEKLAGATDITCVKTNCKVLQEAGFSIEGVSMDGITFPETLMEHLLFRNVFYTDQNGKHKVHFDILNTTEKTLEKYFEDVDTAVVGTRLRHALRHADTEEDKNTRGVIAKRLIAEEAERLANQTVEQENDEISAQRKVTISVPSCLGDAIARIWGRHTIYELDLSDKKELIFEAFQNFTKANEGETDKLRPFPQENPSFLTWLKKHIFFSGPMIRLLRRHMMGRSDVIHLSTQGIFKHLKSTKGARLNYALMDNKLVIAKVKANEGDEGIHKKAADWALSKHALIANREEVYCSGEMWYDEAQNRFKMNGDSGTYTPNFERVKIVVNLANGLFDNQVFESVQADAEGTEVTNIQEEGEDVNSI